MPDSEAWFRMTRDKWTDEEVRCFIVEAAKLGFLKAANAGIDELLRRKQEQCAVHIECHSYCTTFSDCSCEKCADAIRRMK